MQSSQSNCICIAANHNRNDLKVFYLYSRCRDPITREQSLLGVNILTCRFGSIFFLGPFRIGSNHYRSVSDRIQSLSVPFWARASKLECFSGPFDSVQIPSVRFRLCSHPCCLLLESTLYFILLYYVGISWWIIPY